MDDTTGKGLSLTGTIFITIGYITLGVLLFALVVAGVKVAQDRMSGISDQLQQAEFTTFDNGSMSGSQVLNTIRQYMNNDQFGILVTTGKGSSNYYGNTFNANGEIISTAKNTNLIPAQDESDPNYINPSGKFKTSIVYDANGVVRGIVATQTSATR